MQEKNSSKQNRPTEVRSEVGDRGTKRVAFNINQKQYNSNAKAMQKGTLGTQSSFMDQLDQYDKLEMKRTRPEKFRYAEEEMLNAYLEDLRAGRRAKHMQESFLEFILPEHRKQMERFKIKQQKQKVSYAYAPKGIIWNEEGKLWFSKEDANTKEEEPDQGITEATLNQIQKGSE